MLQNWYFCAAIGLSSQDSAAHLDVLAALEEPGHLKGSLEIVCAAVDCLLAAETATVVHAVPAVLGAHRRFAEAPEMARQASAFYRAVASITPEYLRPRMSSLLRAAGSGTPGEAVDLLERVFTEIPNRDPATEPDTEIPPYLDLVEQLAPTLAVATGRFLADLDPQLLRDRFPDSPTVVSDALQGRFGRLALVEAAELSAILYPEAQDDVRLALARASGGAFDLEPDLLMAAARVTFRAEHRPDTTPPSPEELAAQERVLQEIENEVSTGARLLAWIKQWHSGLDTDSPAADARRQKAYLRLGGVGPHRQSAMPAVLWQAILTARSVEIDPDRSAARLARWWRAPDSLPAARTGERLKVSAPYDDYGNVLLHVTRLLSLRVAPGGPKAPAPIFVSGPAADTDPGTAATIWSPWMIEHPPNKPAGRGAGSGPRENKAETAIGWLHGDEPEQLVRLLAAGMVAERLLARGRVGETESEYQLLLVLHIRDVLGRRYRKLLSAIDEHTGLGLVPSGHLAGLLTHVQRLVDRLGKGNRPGLEPTELVRVLTTLHEPQPQRPRVLEGLARYGAGLRAAVSWVRESASGGVGAHRTEAGARWFTGATPAAKSLLDLVAAQPGLTGWTPVEAALLRREIYGDVTAGIVRWDWVPGRGPVSSSAQNLDVDARTLLLSSPTDPTAATFSVEEWELMADELEQRDLQPEGNSAMPITVRTLRLIELLRNPGLGDAGEHDDWVASWTELVKSFNAPLHLPRTVRGRMFEMFGSEVAGPRSQERLLTVLEHAVDVIIDLSSGAPYYYDRLFDLGNSGMTLSGDDANRLRHRILRSVYNRWDQGLSAKTHTNPYSAYGNRVTARGTSAALVRFLRATSHLQLQAHAVDLGSVMEQSWYNAYRPLPLPAVRSDAGATGGDPRLLVAAVTDRRTGEVVRYMRGERLDVAVTGRNRVPVTDLFAADKNDSPPAHRSFLVGVVAGADHSGTTTRLWINCGLPALVEHELARRDRRWRAGRTLAVAVSSNGAVSHGIAMLAAPEPEPGEVRSARLRTTDSFPWLSLTIEGIDVDRYPRGADRSDEDARARWDPDLSRAFGDVGAEEWTTLAAWHGEDRQWVPLDAGLSELAVAQDGTRDSDGPGAEMRLVVCGPATDRSGFGSAWRFATRPGRTYVLGESAWAPEDWERLREELAEHSFGLIIYAGFDAESGRLQLAGPDPFDDRNLRWLAAFGAAMPDAASSDTESGHDLYELAVRAQPEPDQGFAVWRIEAPNVEGFPGWVTADPSTTPLNDRRTLCTIKTWGEREARAARVEIQPVEESGIQGEASIERYAELTKFGEDDLVELTVLLGRNPANAANFVRTASGICGFVDTETLTLSGDFPMLTPASPRLALVTKDEVSPGTKATNEPAPLSHEELLGTCEGLREPAVLDRQRLTGMIATRLLDGDRKVTHLGIWLHLGTEVVEAGPIPLGCFNNNKASVGDHVIANRTAAGWRFAVLRRTLRMRALWTWDKAPGKDWNRVGRVLGDGDRDMDLYQHPKLPRLAWDEVDETAEPDAGRVRAMRAGWQNRRCRAVVQLANRSLAGTASGIAANLTSEFQTVYLEQVQLYVEDVAIEGLPGVGLPTAAYVDVSRDFVLSPVRDRQHQQRAPRPVADPAAAWERALAQSGGILAGPATKEGRVLLSLCQAPDDAGRYQPWIALLDEPRTLVGAREYPTDRVRCVPVPFESGFRGSHLQVPPVTVADFIAEVMPQAKMNGRRCPIGVTVTAKKQRPYYVGLDEADEIAVHRFEFGYGWFLDIPAAALTVEGKPVDPQGLTLFHGDRIDAMAFARDTSGAVPGGIVVDVALADITKGIEHQIHREATDAKVVHMLDVDIDHTTGRVAVLRVHTRTQEFTAGREEIHVRDAAVSATLSPRDAASLLAAFGPKVRRQRVLGRLETETGRPRRKAPRFRIVPAVPADGTGPGLRKGDSLYLDAGVAIITKNDYLLPFGLHPLVDQPEEPLTVIVSRRDFSHRESCLRQAVELSPDGTEVYQGRARMLVRLEEMYRDKPNSWRGVTKSPPARPLYLLRGYLDGLRRSCFGVVAAGGRHVEVRPGVLFPLAGISGADRIPAGSVVRLERGAEGVVARQAVPADNTFLSQRARPAVVFPKDRLRHAEDIKNADADGMFTLGGLPGINATAQKGTGAALLQTRHPKIIGAVRAEGRGTNDALLVPIHDVLAGTVAFAQDDLVSGVRIVPAATSREPMPPGDVAISWAQLSFMDDTATQIAAACTDRYWRYHDKVTRYWIPSRDAIKEYALRPQARSTEEPVFLSSGECGWTLRHDHKVLRRFGFPATELLEDGEQEPANRARRAWAVASADTRGVWLELAPGRLVEVSAELVRFGDGGSLADLDWSFFSPGDLVYGRVEGGVNEYGHLVLDSWRPGLRGALATPAAKRMLLPVAHSDEQAGALYLGEGANSFPYPADHSVLAAHPVARSVWLDRSNSLTALEDSAVAVGDVVFLTTDAGHGSLRVFGLPQASLRFVDSSVRGAWVGTGWLRELLAAANGGARLPSGLDGIPVTVESVEGGSAPVLTVSRRAQPRGDAPAGSLLAQPVADLGRGFIAVRSGSALFRVGMSMILPGMPRSAAVAAAAAFVAYGGTVRLYWDEENRSLSGDPSGGTDSPAGDSETTVRPLLTIDRSDGVCLGLVCRDELSHRLCWLGADDAAWAPGLSGRILLGHLRGLRRLAVLRCGAGKVTLTGHPVIAREYRNLAVGERVRVRVVESAADTAPMAAGSVAPAEAGIAAGTAGHRSVVSVEPAGMLAVYTASEAASLPDAEESLMAEISHVERGAGSDALSLVEPGSRLTIVDLPQWMCDSLARLYEPRLLAELHPVDGLVPERFEGYLRTYREGQTGSAPTPDEPATNRVLRALGALDGEHGRTREAKLTAATALTEWLCSEQGRATVLQADSEIDLAPALAVCWLGAKLGGQVRLSDGWIAYLLARLGDRAVSSLHTEALITGWLTLPVRHDQSGDWRRLRTLKIASKLTGKEVGDVRAFGEAITGRLVVTGKESEAAAVARSLLMAVGHLPSGQMLREDADNLSRLADLGAGVRPPRFAGVPEWSLLNVQKAEVESLARKILTRVIPLVLLPAVDTLTPAAVTYGRKLIRAAEAGLRCE